MDLFADRYLQRAHGLAIDLATAEQVFVRRRSAAPPAAQSAWTIRCSELQSLWHPFLVDLLDFGAIGPAGRFEVLRVSDPNRLWTRRDPSAGWAVASAVQFLHHRKCSAGRLSWRRVVDAGGRPTLLPDSQTGTRLNGRGNEEDGASDRRPAVAAEKRALESMLADCSVGSRSVVTSAGSDLRRRLSAGVVIRPRPAVRQIVEILEACRADEPRSVTLVGPVGSGKSRALLEIAREARLRGFVPASTTLLCPTAAGSALFDPSTLAELLEGRHALIIHRAGCGSHLESRFAELVVLLGTSRPRPRLFLIVRSERVDRASVELTPLSVQSLVEMVSSTGLTGKVPEVILRRLARQSGGHPGRFTRALLGRRRRVAWHASSASALSGLRAAERPETYTVPEVGPAGPENSSSVRAADETGGGSVGWRPPESSSSVRRACERAAKGWALARVGRHAVAERLLRDALGVLARRSDGRAGPIALRLGRLLLSRGRVKEALTAFDAARRHLVGGRAPSQAARVAIYMGLARTDAGHLSEAEAALRSARIAARQLSDGASTTLAGLALARCLLWQGRYDEALAEVKEIWALTSENGLSPHPIVTSYAASQERELADAVHESTAGDREGVAAGVPETTGDALDIDDQDPGVTAACLVARIALAEGDVATAGHQATAALEHARAGKSLIDLAAAHTALAAVHVRVGDLDALRHHVDVGIRSARAAHAPLRVLRLRVLLVEGLRSAGRLGEANQLASRLARVRLDSLPGLLRSRVQQAIDGVPVASSARPRSHAASWGTPSPGRAANLIDHASPATGCSAAVDHIVELLSICHGVEDEQGVLSRVIAAVRQRLRASAAAFVGLHDERLVVLCTSGGQPPSESTARRAADTGLVIPPARSPEGIEGGVPIRYAGAIIGALVCRWLPDAQVDPDQAASVLAAAAAAVAPCARAALDRLASPPVTASESDLIGTSEAVQALRQAISRASSAPFTVLIEGESGTGKELVAQAIHRHGQRRDKRFCALNCAALSDDLLEAELFGHARGAFTGAIAERAGLFEEAHGGTLLLDEIGELSPRAQAKLLRAIQEGEVRRIGENFVRPVDVRLVAASNRPLREEVHNGRFRQDLLYRLDVIRIVVPPLRERVEDIPALAAFFWSQATCRTGSRATLSPATLAALARYDWPGNVRELQNAMAALAVSAPRRGSVGPSGLPTMMAGLASTPGTSTLEEARRLFERRFVRAALARAGGHRGRAAISLGLSRQGFAKLLTRLKLDAT
jgi:DNA-binding NtrC family response regulator/tetratricopeptide (TPR) repeat protein